MCMYTYKFTDTDTYVCIYIKTELHMYVATYMLLMQLELWDLLLVPVV